MNESKSDRSEPRNPEPSIGLADPRSVGPAPSGVFNDPMIPVPTGPSETPESAEPLVETPPEPHNRGIIDPRDDPIGVEP